MASPFCRNFHGHGLALESAESTLAYGIDQFGFQVLDAETRRDNHSSIKLLEKLQFEDVGSIANPNATGEPVLFRRAAQRP